MRHCNIQCTHSVLGAQASCGCEGHGGDQGLHYLEVDYYERVGLGSVLDSDLRRDES